MDASNRHDRLSATLGSLAAEAARRVGVEVVDIHVRGSSRKRLVRVDIDRPGPRPVTLEDCQAVSGALGAAIEETGALHDPYLLEVSSPGADRPIRSLDDIRRNTGRRIVVRTLSPVGSRREFRGPLEGLVDGQLCVLDDDAGEVRIPLGHIEIARQELAF